MSNIPVTENKMEVKGPEKFEEYEMIHFSFSLTFHASLHCFKVLSVFTNVGTKTYTTSTLLDFHF